MLSKILISSIAFLFAFLPCFATAAPRDAEILLNERIVTVSAIGKMETLTRRIVIAKTPRGVQQLKTLTIKIDPKSDQFKLLKALRYTEAKSGTFQKDSGQQAEVFPKELARASQIHVSMPVLAPGDKLEYEILVTREKPLFGTHFWNMHNLSDVFPVRRAVFQITFPGAEKIYFQTHGTLEEPIVTEEGLFKTYSWTAKNLTPIEDAADESIAIVTVSSTNSWEEIAGWFSKIYFDRIGGGHQAQKRARAILESYYGKSFSRMEAINILSQFVANNITNVEKSAESDMFEPSEVDTTLAQMKGDCKDKAVLLVSMLKEMGIDAFPFLVNTERALPLHKMIPTPYYFNHMVVYIPVQRDVLSEMFLDPTLTSNSNLTYRIEDNFTGLLLRP